jgi:diguanylate cyclase (GGDEF)-like protein
LVLTVFAVTVSVTNSRGTARAVRSATGSELYGAAFEALSAQAERAEDMPARNGEGTRDEYKAADLTTHEALQALGRVQDDSHGPDEVEALLTAHNRYRIAVQTMFALASKSPRDARSYAHAYVEPLYEPLAAALAHHLQVRTEDAGVALASIARSQRLLRAATPALFGAGMVLLAMFMVMLARARRLVVVKADENRHQSLHDALTGLPNRTLLHLRGEFCLRDSAVTGTPVALMLLDVDRFKDINDTLGHHHGDLVLQELTDRLCLAVRSTDTVARLGGDEFAVLLPQVEGMESTLAVAARLQAALQTSVDAGGVLLDVDISVGVAMSGAHGGDFETMLQHADIAMYQAKARDMGVCVYDDALNEHSREQLGLLGQLRRALDNDELVLHFQPQMSLSTGGFCRAEALLRWNHPTRGMIPPALFIPAAEHTALIRPLTNWVVNAALAECKRWQDDGYALKLAVNVSARNLLDASFADDVLDLLARWDLPASCLLLEVTESAIMLDPARAEAILSRFAEMGIELAIDDFGAGYTSMAALGTLPVQELKIDRSLVSQMSVSAGDALIVKAIIDLGHSLGLRTVAEGVEDADTLQRLGIMGCDVAQGFHLARPMSGARLSVWHGVERAPLSIVAPAEGLAVTAGDLAVSAFLMTPPPASPRTFSTDDCVTVVDNRGPRSGGQADGDSVLLPRM